MTNSSWKKMSDIQPENGTKFCVMYHDGSGAYAYLKTDEGDILGCEDGMLMYWKFNDNDIWSYLPDDFDLWFMTCYD